MSAVPSDTMPRVPVLGCPVDVADMATAIARIVRWVETGSEPNLVVTINPEMVMLAQRDPDFRRVLERAGLLVPDGIGVVRALRRRGFAPAERVTGVELVCSYASVAAARGHRLAFVGAPPGVAARAAVILQRRQPELRVVAVDSGAPDAALAERVAQTRPDVVCAAFGHGRQERFLDEHLARMGATVGIGVGGTFDYISGAVRRAPAMLRSAGLEWAWRLLLDPRRVRRQAVLPIFWSRERREAQGERRSVRC